jgi:hypothetical protein
VEPITIPQNGELLTSGAVSAVLDPALITMLGPSTPLPDGVLPALPRGTLPPFIPPFEPRLPVPPVFPPVPPDGVPIDAFPPDARPLIFGITSPVPEPPAWVLLLGGIVLLGALTRRAGASGL